jgi:hypothetical protein
MNFCIIDDAQDKSQDIEIWTKSNTIKKDGAMILSLFNTLYWL